MAASESVTFDFISRGADRLAGDFRKTGDNAVLAARGAKVLADALDKLGSKENRTAQESLLLARALRLTGDAQDKAAAKALAADAAFRRLNDAVGDASGKRRGGFFSLTSLLHPLAAGFDAASQAGGGFLSTVGSVATSSPEAAAAVAGLAAGAVAAAAALAPVTAALIPITLGFAGLAAVGAPEVTKVFGALTASGKAATAAMKGLSPAERDLVHQAEPLKDSFAGLQKAVQPEILKAFGTGIKIVKDLMPALRPLVVAAGKALDAFLGSMDHWLKSPSGQAFVNWLKTQGPRDIKLFGRIMWDVAVGVGIALDHIYRAGKWVDEHFVQFFVHDIPSALSAAAQFIRAWTDRVELVFLAWAKTFIHAAADAFGWIPGLGGKLHAADRALASFIASTEARLHSLTARQYTVDFGIHLPPGVRYAGQAGHAVPYAAGTMSAAPGWRVVGERGPELEYSPRGGEVIIPNHALRGYAGGTGEVTVHLSLPSLKAISQVFSSAVGAIVHSVRTSAVLGGGFAGGGLGRASLRQIEDYWVAAGGPGGIIAHIAAAITGAESGFNPRAIQQGQPYSTTGWGLWQITPGNSEPQAGINYQLLNPYNNAIAAVAKFRQAGNSFLPWTTFQDGAYLQFMDRGGWLRPGMNMIYNGTGRRERVLGPQDAGTVNIHVTVNVPVGPADPRLGQHIADSLKAHVRRGGSLYPAGVAPR